MGAAAAETDVRLLPLVDRMIEQTSKANDSMWRWLPLFVGGVCGPLLGNLLSRWLPLHYAVGVAFFIMWLIVGLIFSRMSPSPKWSFARWLGGGALGAAAAAVLAFFFPWK